MKLSILLITTVVLSVQLLAAQPKTNTVCDLIQRQVLKGKTIEVRIEGQILADKHRILITDPACKAGIYVVHKWGQQGTLWSKFDDNLLDKRSPEERRPLFVRLVGYFSIKSEEGELYRVLDVTRVEFCEFDKQPTTLSDTEEQ